MNVRRISLVLLGLIALSAGLLLFVMKRQDVYETLGSNANREIQEAERKPALAVNSGDARTVPELIPDAGPAKIIRDDKTNRRKTAEYYSADKKIIAIDYFGDDEKLVRRDIYDDQGRLRLRQFYNSAGRVVKEDAFNEKRAKINRRKVFPINPGWRPY